MPRPKNPYRLVLQQNRVEPQVMQGVAKNGEPEAHGAADELARLQAVSLERDSLLRWIVEISNTLTTSVMRGDDFHETAAKIGRMLADAYEAGSRSRTNGE